ncbi:MAG: aspartate kinase [Bacteroidia bacterium]|nr:aspartate kinase [Bacteroidia bacterium]
MKVFKFGGASVKDAGAVKNVAAILNKFPTEQLIVVISAMGKTTNALEKLTDAFFYKKGDAETILAEIKEYHFKIMDGLFENRNHAAYTEIENAFVELHWAIEDEPAHTYNHEYDQIVSIGEIVSTKIISAYLNSAGVKNTWMDARGLIQTDNTYRDAKVDFELTENCVKNELLSKFKESENGIIITQGFIGGTSENFTTTLGREGSDYTAAILAYCSNAESVTIWKDVPGVLNADPKWFDNTVKLNELTYQDAIELTYYGATVIHPKTIKPLQNKNIPLFVKSFLDPKEEGTVIHESDQRLNVASYIFKVDQILISIQPKDFSFIAEDNLSFIFSILSKHGVKVNMMQNSAISFSICVDNDEYKITSIIDELKDQFKVLYNTNVELMTVRNYDADIVNKLAQNKIILMEQRSRNTHQLIIKSE